MASRTEKIEAALCARLFLRCPQGIVEHMAFWQVPVAVVSFCLYWLPGILGGLASVVLFVSLLLLIVSLLILTYRWISRQVFWAVRNRIIVTCLLLGLAPVILFGSLTTLSAYVFAGQFATYGALAALDQGLEQMRDRVTMYGSPAARALERNPDVRLDELPSPALSIPLHGVDENLRVEAWEDGAPLKVENEARALDRQEALPPWLHPGFSGVVQEGNRLYLRAVVSYQAPHHTILVLASIPLLQPEMDLIAQGVGVVQLRPRPEPGEGSMPGGRMAPLFHTVQGGRLPGALNPFDTRVSFVAPLRLTDWKTGAEVEGWIGVSSRPVLLYRRLFSSSVRIGDVVRDALAALAILFGILQLLAIYMAVRLSRTITRSVASLYHGTTEIDRGNLQYRVPVERRDQLAALATSFNTMAGSLEELLIAQREQERIQNELAIAQEVQKNLFPHSPIGVVGLEVHGICKPARTVSGDYFDFIQSGPDELCLTLGDISGKGISAALLMASLHSAVRAYRAPTGNDGDVPSPGRLLSLLNKHLYSSTQPEKYATLFFACYDRPSRKLVYSNGGQLPPYVIRANGTMERLDRGGSVVGLLKGMQYEEGEIVLEPGDLLIAYSDGVTEPENEFGEFGEARLLAIARQYRDQPLASLSAHIMRELSNWIGNAEQPDDITLVLARQKAAATPR